MPLSQIVSDSIQDGAVAPVDLSSVAQYTGFKNRLINGGMGIWQRGTTFTSTSYIYSADRWADGVWGTNTTASRSTDTATGFQYSLKIQRPAAATATTIVGAIQTIESVNCYDLAGQTVTLSFWAKAGANYSSSGGVLGAQVATGTVADQGGLSYGAWTGLALPINNQSSVLTTSWQKFSYTATLGAGVLEAAVVFYYVPVGTAGADDSFYVTGVQLEKGVTATSFDYRPYGTELALCQRYYYKQQAVTTATVFGSGFNNAATNAVLLINFPVTMRTSPAALEQTGTAANYSVYYQGGSALACSSVPIFNTGDVWSATVLFTVASGLTAGQASMARANNTAAYLAWSAEL